MRRNNECGSRDVLRRTAASLTRLGQHPSLLLLLAVDPLLQLSGQVAINFGEANAGFAANIAPRHSPLGLDLGPVWNGEANRKLAAGDAGIDAADGPPARA